MAAPLPHVALVGRANVGKSTLFNRLTRQRRALVNNQPGVTRDRIYGRVEGFGRPFMLIDTGGVDLDASGRIENQVLCQADVALEEADAVIFLTDARQGPTPQDQEVIEKLRKSGKPLFVAVNKIDAPGQEALVHEFARWGVAPVFPVSAEHGPGVAELVEAVARKLPAQAEAAPETEHRIRVAVVGRPNVGKSSWVNRLLKEERCIVSSLPGTTRDSIDTALEFGGQSYLLTDTAGIRRKGKTRQVLEKISVLMALKALERSDIAALLLDATQGVTDQDATIGGYILEKGRGCLICVNKWDLAAEQGLAWKAFETEVRNRLKFLEFAPIMPISAATGQGTDQFFPRVEEVFREYDRTLPTSKLNACFEQAIEDNPMSTYRGKSLKLYYATQVRSRPPTIQCYMNYPQGVHFSYQRYLVNRLRKRFGLSGTPVRLIFKSRHPG